MNTLQDLLDAEAWQVQDQHASTIKTGLVSGLAQGPWLVRYGKSPEKRELARARRRAHIARLGSQVLRRAARLNLSDEAGKAERSRLQKNAEISS